MRALRHLQHSLSQPIKSCYDWGRGRYGAVQYFRRTYPLTSIQSSMPQVSNDKERKDARMWLR